MRRFPLIVVASIALLAALAVTLAVLNIDRALTDAAGAANLRHLWPWWFASAALWAVLTALWRKLRHAQDNTAWRRSDVWVILAVAVAARVAVLIVHEPVLSDDIHRYTFDGRNLAAGENPYLVTPAQRLDAATQRWPDERVTAAMINNPERHTIYLPASQYVFAGIALVVSDNWSDPQSAARVFRAVFIVFDVALIALLLRALRLAGRSPWWGALYAWHPLAITEIAGSGHQDVIGIMLVVGGLTLATSSTTPRIKTWLWLIPIAIATVIKPVAALAGLFIARWCTIRATLTAGLTGSAAVFVLCAPLLLTHNAQPLQNLSDTATRFTTKWAHFGSIYEPALAGLRAIDPIGDPEVQWQKKDRQEAVARGICLTLVGFLVAVTLLRRVDPWTASRIVLLAIVLLSPTAHPWYLLWALALMPMSPSPALWLASLTLPWGYAVFGDPVEWEVSVWVYAAAYLPVYAALVFEVRSAARRRDRSSMQSSVGSTTIAS